MTGLCAECHKNAAIIQRNSNLSEEEKSEVIVNRLVHAYKNLTADAPKVWGASLQGNSWAVHVPKSMWMYT